jgi:hypothetical protein
MCLKQTEVMINMHPFQFKKFQSSEKSSHGKYIRDIVTLTYINSLEPSLSCEAKSRSASQDIHNMDPNMDPKGSLPSAQ